MQNVRTPLLRRKIEINNHEFTVFGKAPWITIPVEASDKNPECVIIIEASLLAYCMVRNRLTYNALTRKASNGAQIGVVFTGAEGKARAREICMKINDKLG
jgi:hypothetical protein